MSMKLQNPTVNYTIRGAFGQMQSTPIKYRLDNGSFNWHSLAGESKGT